MQSSGQHKNKFFTWRRLVKGMAKAGIFAAKAGAVSVVSGSAYLGYEVYSALKDLPDVNTLDNYKQPVVNRILARDGLTELGSFYEEKRTLVKVETLPAHVKLAFLAAEDKDFYEHEGISWIGVMNAFARGVLNPDHRMNGASTLTQQLIKNTIGTNEYSIRRKLKEGILAHQLENKMRKDGILELYLNTIFFGNGANGIEEAARTYFGKHAADISLRESAVLASLPKYPSSLMENSKTPEADIRKVLGRADDYVLKNMVEAEFITQEQADAAKAAPIEIAPRKAVNAEPEIVEIARKQLLNLVGQKALDLGGYTVLTSIDASLQKAARVAVQTELPNYDKDFHLQAPFRANAKRQSSQSAQYKPFVGTPKVGKVYVGQVVDTDDKAGTISVQVGNKTGILTLEDIARFNPEHLPPGRAAQKGALLRVTMPQSIEEAMPLDLSLQDHGPQAAEEAMPLDLSLQDHGPQAALVSIEVATGEVKAIVGSYEGGYGLNRAIDVKRQPGSTFKPIHYSYALQMGDVTPITRFEGIFASGETTAITFRRGVEKSNNDVAKIVFGKTAPNTEGIQKILEWTQGFGIDTSAMQPDTSLALGSYEVSPIQMAGAYAVFAAGGVYRNPVIILRVIDNNTGQDIALPPRVAHQAIEPATAWMMTDILKGVITNGTGVRALPLKEETQYAIAGKTGTTNYENQTRDVWFSGYTPDLVTTAWSGYDQYGGGLDGMGEGLSVSGGRYALPIVASFMRVALAGRQPLDFGRPEGVIDLDVEPKSGHIYAAIENEAFPENVTALPAPVQPATESFYLAETFEAENCEGGEYSYVERVTVETGEPQKLVSCIRPAVALTTKEAFISSAMHRVLQSNPAATLPAAAAAPVMAPTTP